MAANDAPRSLGFDVALPLTEARDPEDAEEIEPIRQRETAALAAGGEAMLLLPGFSGKESERDDLAHLGGTLERDEAEKQKTHSVPAR